MSKVLVGICLLLVVHCHGIGDRIAQPQDLQKTWSRQLFRAVKMNNLCMLKQALQNHADPNEHDADGFVPLCYAVIDNNVTSINVLIRAGARVDFVDNQACMTPLMFAVINGKINATKALIAGGAKLDLIARDGNDALSFALREGHDSIARLLYSATELRKFENMGAHFVFLSYRNYNYCAAEYSGFFEG